MLQTAVTPFSPANCSHPASQPYCGRMTANRCAYLNTSWNTLPKQHPRPTLQSTVFATAAAAKPWPDGSKSTCLSKHVWSNTSEASLAISATSSSLPAKSSKHRFSTQGGSGRCRRLGDSRVFGGTARRRYPAKSRFCWTCAATHRGAALRLCAAAPLLRLTLAFSFMRPAQIPGALAWPGPRPSTSSPPGINYRRVLNT
jgi:hypothetical protein